MNSTFLFSYHLFCRFIHFQLILIWFHHNLSVELRKHKNCCLNWKTIFFSCFYTWWNSIFVSFFQLFLGDSQSTHRTFTASQCSNDVIGGDFLPAPAWAPAAPRRTPPVHIRSRHRRWSSSGIPRWPFPSSPQHGLPCPGLEVRAALLCLCAPGSLLLAAASRWRQMED